ncbi:MAG: hypothetical protein WC549_05465 [Actinomycetota bacterium]
MSRKIIKTANEIFEIINADDLLGEKIEKRDCIASVIDFLKSEIPRNAYINDKDAQYQKLWEKIGKWFEKRGRIHEAKIIFESLYNELTISQIENNNYIHKGMPLVWLCDYSYYHFKQPWLAQIYILLTIIEDSIATAGNINPNSTGSYYRAVWIYNIKDEYFKMLEKKAFEIYNSNNELGIFPEWILNNFENIIPVKFPSKNEIDICVLNTQFSKYWLKKIKLIPRDDKNKGKIFEDFCSYLLSCIPGFEIEKRFETKDYHFDLLIRNKSNANDFRDNFGNYLIAECKNWSDPIGTQEIAYFVSKLIFHDIKAGFIFSKEGITGKNKNTNATLILIKSFYKIGRFIMLITEKDIKNIISGKNFISVLQAKYEESRFTI